jgi:hypothetical protein
MKNQCCGSGAFLNPGSGLRDPGRVKSQDPDLGSGSGMNIQDHISESLETIFWVKIHKFFGADPDPGSGVQDGKLRKISKILLSPFKVSIARKELTIILQRKEKSLLITRYRTALKQVLCLCVERHCRYRTQKPQNTKATFHSSRALEMDPHKFFWIPVRSLPTMKIV